MPARHSIWVILALGAAFSGASCKKMGQGGAASASALGVGKHLVLWAPKGVACPVRAGARAEDVGATKGTPLEGDPSVASPTQVDIAEARRDVAGNGVFARAVQKDGRSTWLWFPSDRPVPCLESDIAPLESAVALVGKRLSFAPWRPSCRAVEAAGQAPESVLIDSDPSPPLEVTGVVFGGATAKDFASSGSTLWLKLGDDLVDARLDSVRDCFSERPDSPGDVAQRIAPGRCEKDAADPKHVVCSSTVATWAGAVTMRTVELRRVWRTLGPLHFYDGQPVDGTRFAKTVVAVDLDPPRGDDIRRLHAGLDTAIKSALGEASSGTVRVAAPGEASVSYRLRLAVADVRLGDLSKSEVTETSEYKERDETRPNPKKDQLRSAAEQARQAAQDAQDQFDRDSQEWEEAKQKAYELCQQGASSISNQGLSGLAHTGCDVGRTLAPKPSRDALEQANRDRDKAQADYDDAPETITVPIMGNHPYSKRVFSRSAGATVVMDLVAPGQAPRTERIPVTFNWSDYEVTAEPQYNVAGHSPDQGPIGDGHALLGPLGERIAGVVAAKVKQAVFAADLEDAERAFVAAGNAPPNPDFQTVDALAFRTAGKRIDKPVLRGRAGVSKSNPAELPTAAVTLAPGQCLLAVAVAAQGREDARLTLRTRDGTYADERGRPFAIVEACKDDLGDARPGLVVESPDSADIRWGLYTTRPLP